MSKLAVAALVIVAAVAVQGSLFGPFGPFGQPGAATPAFGPPAFVQPGFFPGYAPPAFPPTYGPPAGFPSGFAPVPFPLASRARLAPGLTKPTPFPKTLGELLLDATLPADLKEKADQLVVEFEQSNAVCDATFVPFGPTASSLRLCKAVNRVTVELAAQALKTEAAARVPAVAEQAETAAVEDVVAEEAPVAAVEEAEAGEEPAVDVQEPVAEVEVEESVPTADEDVVVVVEEASTA